jgi:hypothetical protein
MESALQTIWGYLFLAENLKIYACMERNYLPLAKDVQKKFYDWFSDPVSADPPFPAEAKHSIGASLQKLLVAINSFMVRAETKSLSIGLFIGMSATGLLLTGMVFPPKVSAIQSIETATTMLPVSTSTPAPTSTISLPTSTYTPTPTLIQPTPTATVTETATVTPTVPSPNPTFSDPLMELMQNGYLWQVGPLGLRDQIRVYESSLQYIRTSTVESRLIGEQIAGPGYGAPSNICGPLSIAILQGAGIVRPDIDPHAFWLLNPDVKGDRKLLSKVFPPGWFENIRFRVPLNKMDWREFPLYPGDFIYFYAGSGGNFEHMLVVNRVDVDGRAYAVTNHKTSDGFIISEVLLYNPTNPDVGMFPVWTARPNAENGSTGFGGFELWRLRTP